LTYYHKYPSLN